MNKKRIFLTGASGSMGQATLKQLLKANQFEVVALIRDTALDKEIMKPYEEEKNLKIYYGDLTVYQDVLECVKGCNIVLHIAAFVSPAADDYPELAMQINYGSTINIINAIKEQPNWQQIRLVNIGTIAQTGDRMPPIHWGRVGDPIKPSVHDYYAVSKIAAERAVVESGLKYWVSLRQTGIMSEKMVKHSDPIMFHNCLDNVLEYVSDYDSGVMMKNCCEDLPDDFWGHIYNIGGGKSCRVSCYQMFEDMFKPLGFKNLENILDAKWFATRNFHGTYYLDSDRLNDYLQFRSHGIDYFYTMYLKNMGLIVPLAKFINKLPGGEKFMGAIIKKTFAKHLMANRGTMNWITNNKQDYIKPYFVSKEEWDKIPSLNQMKHFTKWDEVVHIDHGYDETKEEAKLTIEDVKGAAVFRGGECLSEHMSKGDWTSKLQWKCAFGHQFEASPRLILEGGHWCPECESKSWNYHEIAKTNPFFAQVWYPLHEKDEPSAEYKKIVSEKNVKGRAK
jgi:nucleoside-diphosphate-sugar epimerase